LEARGDDSGLVRDNWVEAVTVIGPVAVRNPIPQSSEERRIQPSFRAPFAPATIVRGSLHGNLPKSGVPSRSSEPSLRRRYPCERSTLANSSDGTTRLDYGATCVTYTPMIVIPSRRSAPP